MALAGYPKTFASPKITQLDAASESVTGTIDFVKMVGDDSTDEIVMKYKSPGDDTIKTCVVFSGDTIEGPFSYVELKTETSPNSILTVYERSGEV